MRLGWGSKEEGGGMWPVVGGSEGGCEWTVAVHAQATPALSCDALRCSSLSAASSQARRDLEALLSAASQRKAEMARETAMLDAKLSHVSKGFDQVVLQMMLHFQELHQALEARENELLSDARTQMLESIEHLKARRAQLQEQGGEVDQGILLASRYRSGPVPE
ncbi:hypothetical protein T484DRAFT_1944740 [Baffinella frigidus]|nr:hypothetical protein T484DRAFT_1944740 [Cryptophyta sp. CCMP2293]